MPFNWKSGDSSPFMTPADKEMLHTSRTPFSIDNIQYNSNEDRPNFDPQWVLSITVRYPSGQREARRLSLTCNSYRDIVMQDMVAYLASDDADDEPIIALLGKVKASIGDAWTLEPADADTAPPPDTLTLPAPKRERGAK